MTRSNIARRSNRLLGRIAARRLFGMALAAGIVAALFIGSGSRRVSAQATEVCGRDLRVLIIAANGSEVDLPAIRQTLDYLGTPYTIYLAAQNPGGLTADRLSNGCHANYQAVIQTTGDLGYMNGTAWTTALTPTEVNTLRAYEAMFKVRSVSWYTYPNPDHGLTWPTGAVDTSSSPLKAQLTAAGRAVFPYINTGASSPASPIVIQYAYTYLAQPFDATSTPLLTDSAGHSLAVVTTFPDGRENLAMTFDSNPYLLHTMLLGYGVVNWVTRGLFLGERHIYLSPQVDDVFIEDDQWVNGTSCSMVGHDRGPNETGPTIRMTGNDLWTVVDWQDAKNLQPTTANLRLTMAINGWGATGVYRKDTLTRTAKQTSSTFYWISHTYDHATLDGIGYAAASNEFTMNNAVASWLPLPLYNSQSLVTPSISGLKDAQVMQAAFDAGVRYVVTDTSIAGQDNPFPNVGIYNWMQPKILMIPRRPVNLFYNVASPADWASEYNCIYRSYFGRDLTYQEILDFVSNQLLPYLLRGEKDPWMFHQPNLVAYDGTHTLLTDLLDRTLAKYNGYFTLPIVSPPMHQLGRGISDRMNWLSARVTATLQPGGLLTLSSDKAVNVPVTGLTTSTSEIYGGQAIGWATVPAGGTVNFATPYTITGNLAPSVPAGPSPASGATGVSTSTSLTWSATNATSYDVRFGTTNPPPQAATGLVSASYTPALASKTNYFWQIVARNGAGTTTGPVWSFTTAAPSQIVIYASDIPAGALHGNWSFASDPTSPNGIKLVSVDNGWATFSNPLAAPADYIDIPFQAAAATPYTIWLRIQALGNSKWNDSLWVQFSDAQSGGVPVHPMNTTSGLMVNLATDSLAWSLNGWGWQNTAYWLTQVTTVTFPTNGTHTLRVQIREDGVQFDQIVLNPTTTLPPGGLTNDLTIVPK